MRIFGLLTPHALVDTEIGDFGSVLSVDKYIVGFQIPVNQAYIMGSSQAFGDLQQAEQALSEADDMFSNMLVQGMPINILND